MKPPGLRRGLPPLASLGLLATLSCAPLPPPAGAPVPPSPGSRAQTTTPDTTSRLHEERKAEKPAGAVEVSSREPMITIGLAWDLDSLTLDPVGPAELEGTAEATVEPGEWLTVKLDGQGAVVGARGGREPWQAALWPGDTLWLMPAEGGRDSRLRFVRWNGRSWRGYFKVFLNPRGKLTVATRLSLEAYLLGVIPGEIGALADDLLEAGRAQAVAARSFTLFYTGRRGVEGFDLFSTVEDQVYGPVESEKPLATRCVETTAGEVAVFDGAPIRANYSSTCGGITADVGEAWATPPLPYLVGLRDIGRDGDFCRASPHYRWHEEWSVHEFMANLRRFGPTYGVHLPEGGLGELVDARVGVRSRSGRVWSLTVVTTRGEIAIPAYSLRQVVRRPGNPDAILRSNLFKIAVRRDPDTRRALAVVANGAGSGHGVGLCQTGALGMARASAKGEEIIRHYFANTEIQRLY